jgi:hypothetical protein
MNDLTMQQLSRFLAHYPRISNLDDGARWRRVLRRRKFPVHSGFDSLAHGYLEHSLVGQRMEGHFSDPHLKERKTTAQDDFSSRLHFLQMELVRRLITRTMDLSLSVYTSELVRRLVSGATLASESGKVNVFYVWKVQYPAVVKDRV